MVAERLAAALADRYRIDRELGTGGMATVYLAEDFKHHRKVAVKVLKPELAAVLGAERFVQEITTTAALQHPHILPLFDSGTADGFLYYVMPFIDGETLRGKLDRETQLSIDEAVKIASEVADALDYAHRHGVIHRDIKPENILLHDGRPMVADFGIALAVSAAAGGRMTETGLSLGTPHYMSPEQATAEKEITARSDVYSLGSVLYEMLTGNPPHMGSSAQQIIMKIITETPQPVTALRKSVPPNVAAAVARSLEKLPADRFESAKAFREALADPHFATRSPTAGSPLQSAGRQRLAVPGLSIALAAMTLVAAWALTRPESPRPVFRSALALPSAQAPDPMGFGTASADGSFIVYLGASGDGPTQLWIKARDGLTASPMSGTAGATSISLSRDGAWIALVQGHTLRKMPVSGGPLIPVAERVANVPGSVLWLDDNTIVYAANEGRKLVRVPADGGAGTVIWASDSLLPMSLSGLPDSRGVLFQACRAPCDQAGTGLWVVDLRSRAARQLAPRVRTGQYLASGHLALVRDDQNVTVVPFDLRSLQVRGAPTTVLDGVAMPGGMPYFSVSAGGTLVMRQGVPPESRMYELVWVDRAGRQSLVDSSFTFKVTQFAGNYGWALSPDGGRLAIGLNTIEGDDIWIKSLPRGAVSRVTFGAASVSRPRWLPDGRSVTFVAQGDAGGVFIRRTDGTGKDSLLWRGSVDEAAYSPDHRWLVIRKGAVSATAGGRDIFGVQLGVDTTLVPLIATAYDEHAFSISPDGRWIIYQSDETGRLEVFIRPFPNTGDTKVQVSIGGGTAPLWSRNGRELFYLRPDNRMMAVSVPADPVLRLGDPQVLFEVPAALTILASSYYTPWDVGPDGRFIFARPVENATQPDSPLIVVENWTEEVKLKVRR